MSYSLLTRYQPKTFDDYQLDADIRDLLRCTIQFDLLNILLVANSGCGKSALVRTIVNSYFKGHPKATDNILRISSVKEQGVAYYRGDVRTFCQSLSSIPGRKRIVVLDDIDLLTDQSQQVFRNCIDKFQKNVHFLATCTNPQKVNESLQSRLMSIRIPPLSHESLACIMKNIMEKEKLSISDDAVEFILAISRTSARTMINYLEKIKILDRHVDMDTAQSLCTDIPLDDFEKYMNFCRTGDLVNAISVFNSLYDNGFSVMDIMTGLYSYLIMTASHQNTSNQVFEMVPCICKQILVFMDVHEHPVELSFFTANLLKIFR